MSHLPRSALRLGALGLFAALAIAPPARGIDPHLDSSLLTASCSACHRGHGEPRSPMLPASQKEVCLGCHESQAQLDELIGGGLLAADARPSLLSSALSQPHVHPLTEGAHSREDPEAVTCTSCHAPHRSSQSLRGSGTAVGEPRLSTRRANEFEYEMCQECHGSAGVTAQDPFDLSRFTNPNNTSFHPIEAPSPERAASVLPELSGAEISCSDCHGNSDTGGARGPHGSPTRFILRLAYTTGDGLQEAPDVYALCYQCHTREAVLDSSPFPLHRLHVVEQRASCASCHNPHGSPENRSLIRFDEESVIRSATPSLETGRLQFQSAGPGSGTCHLTCHGVDHAPLSYGSGAKALSDELTAATGRAAAARPQPPLPRPKGRRFDRDSPP